MDKNRVIELLKQALSRTPHLRELKYDNREFTLWKNEVCDILEVAFGKNSTEYDRFARAVTVTVFADTDMERQEMYIGDLNAYETALKSIIRKHELLGVEAKPSVAKKLQPEAKTPKEFISIVELVPKAFISHGKESIALTKVERFLHTLGIEPLIVKDQPSLGKTVDDKVNYYLSQADFVVILATGDDEIDGKLHPRQNVIHEVGLAQEKHAGKIIYLLEEGAEFPSNISPKVWERFNQENMENVFLRIIVELRGFEMLMWPA